MPSEIINPSQLRTLNSTHSFSDEHSDSRHNVKFSTQERISSRDSHQDTKLPSRHTNSWNEKAWSSSNTCSPQAECQFCEFIETSYWESESEHVSIPPSTAACALCATEPVNSSHGPSPVERRKIPQLPVCVDPKCSENVCEDCPESVYDDCPDPEETCQDCVAQCISDCKDSICGDGLDCIADYDFPCDDSYTDLFGDQAAQIFDFDGRLHPLSSDSTPFQFGVPGLCLGDVKASAFEKDFGSHGEIKPSSGSIQLGLQNGAVDVPLPAGVDICTQGHTPADTLDEYPSTKLDPDISRQATPSAYTSARMLRMYEGNGTLTPHISPQLRTASQERSSDSGQPRTALRAPTNSPLLQDHDLRRKQSSPKSHDRPSIQCQWAGSDGKPCNLTFELATELHEHLKNVHEVKSEVFCRWIGCRFGVLGPTPHQYANSVERHTWGHSGYRPYKCSTCSEGFAAANVRDEHFNNFHLKRKMFSCDLCSHECTSARNLKRHKDDTHTTERFQCEFCNQQGKIRLFPRASNLARHFRKCKVVLALFPDAVGAAEGKISDDWFPTGYRAGHQGMDKAKVRPPGYLPVKT